ncbi:MAG: Gp138 family membrane-puncturing spike protein [Chloroflexi bacterium]|nr:Gp138 family membrane-puncturing spike protein [Chloroflexota bacterium]
MSNLDPEIRRNNLSSAVRSVLGQFRKSPNAAIPGIVHAYDPATRRATVQPAIDLLLTNGTRVSQPLIPNVPVVWPATAQWTMVAPLAAGDAVLLVISQRGLTDFKRRFQQAAPDVDRIMSLSDAVAIPGFGPTRITPASAEGVAIQSTDGAISLTLEPDGRVLHNGEEIGGGWPGEFAPTAPPNLRIRSDVGNIQIQEWDASTSPWLPILGYLPQLRVGEGSWMPYPGYSNYLERESRWLTAPRRTRLRVRVRAYTWDGPSPWTPTLDWVTTS